MFLRISQEVQRIVSEITAGSKSYKLSLQIRLVSLRVASDRHLRYIGTLHSENNSGYLRGLLFYKIEIHEVLRGASSD